MHKRMRGMQIDEQELDYEMPHSGEGYLEIGDEDEDTGAMAPVKIAQPLSDLYEGIGNSIDTYETVQFKNKPAGEAASIVQAPTYDLAASSSISTAPVYDLAAANAPVGAWMQENPGFDTSEI